MSVRASALGPQPETPPSAAVRRSYRSTRWALRIGLFVQAAAAVTQPVLAGLYLSGNLDAIQVHSIIGSSFVVITFGTFLLAVVHWLIGRGPVWPVGATLALIVLATTQAVAGFSRTLGLHVPLGVTVVGSCVVLFGWSVGGRERIRPRRAGALGPPPPAPVPPTSEAQASAPDPGRAP